MAKLIQNLDERDDDKALDVALKDVRLDIEREPKPHVLLDLARNLQQALDAAGIDEKSGS